MGKEVEVSKKLLDFIEKEFKSMVRYQGELDRDRRTKLPELKKMEQKESVRAKRSGKIQPKSFEPLSTRERAWKGKTKFDFNEFVYMCDYFLVLENNKITRDRRYSYSDLNEWISNFLTQRRYKRGNGKPYTGNDIKRIINKQFDEYLKINVKGFVEDMYDNLFEKFCNPQKRLSTKPPYAGKLTSWQSAMDWDSFVKDKPPI